MALFRNGIKKKSRDRTKIALKQNVFRKTKKRRHVFVVHILKKLLRKF